MFHLSWRAATNLVVFLIVDGILKPRKCVHRGQNMWDHITYWQIAIYDFPLHSPLVVSLFSVLFKNLKKGPLLGDCKLAQSKQILKIEKAKWKRVEDHLIFFGNKTSIYTDIFLELLAFNTIDYFFLKYFLLWISVTPCSLVFIPLSYWLFLFHVLFSSQLHQTFEQPDVLSSAFSLSFLPPTLHSLLRWAHPFL